MSLIIAAIPAYNEERSIAKMVIGCKKYVDRVVVVDDGSADATSEIAEALGAYVVRHKQNVGYGAALRTCFKVAREYDADVMVVLDILDIYGQHDPAEIPKLLAQIQSGADLVIGSRFCYGDGKNIPAYRTIGRKILDAATDIAGGINVTDSQSGFRAYGKRAIDTIVIKQDGMSASLEILLQAKENNLKVEEVEISCHYDVESPPAVLIPTAVIHGFEILFETTSLIHFIDSYIINCIYVFSLTSMSSIILYIFYNLIQLDLKSSLLILSIYLMCEISLLFYREVFEYIFKDQKPKIRSSHFYPTPAIFISTPFAFIYLLVRKRDLYIFRWDGIKIVWGITKYNITNPKWLNSKDYKEIRIGGHKGSTLHQNRNPLSMLAQWVRKCI